MNGDEEPLELDRDMLDACDVLTAFGRDPPTPSFPTARKYEYSGCPLYHSSGLHSFWGSQSMDKLWIANREGNDHPNETYAASVQPQPRSVSKPEIISRLEAGLREILEPKCFTEKTNTQVSSISFSHPPFIIRKNRRSSASSSFKTFRRSPLI